MIVRTHSGSTAPPGTQSEILKYSSHILACIYMKLCTLIDLIEPNNFRALCHRLRPTGSELFRAVSKKHALEFEILL